MIGSSDILSRVHEQIDRREMSLGFLYDVSCIDLMGVKLVHVLVQCSSLNCRHQL